jgi:hypothetical protein
MVKTKESIFKETQLMFLQQPSEGMSVPQLPQFPENPTENPMEALSFKSSKAAEPETEKAGEEKSFSFLPAPKNLKTVLLPYKPSLVVLLNPPCSLSPSLVEDTDLNHDNAHESKCLVC